MSERRYTSNREPENNRKRNGAPVSNDYLKNRNAYNRAALYASRMEDNEDEKIERRSLKPNRGKARYVNTIENNISDKDNYDEEADIEKVKAVQPAAQEDNYDDYDDEDEEDEIPSKSKVAKKKLYDDDDEDDYDEDDDDEDEKPSKRKAVKKKSRDDDYDEDDDDDEDEDEKPSKRKAVKKKSRDDDYDDDEDDEDEKPSKRKAVKKKNRDDDYDEDDDDDEDEDEKISERKAVKKDDDDDYDEDDEDDEDGEKRHHSERSQVKSANYASIGKFILFTAFTLGIYFLMYVYRTTKQLNKLKGYGKRSPGGCVFLTMIIPFYTLYWNYCTATRLDSEAKNKGLPCDLAIKMLGATAIFPYTPFISFILAVGGLAALIVLYVMSIIVLWQYLAAIPCLYLICVLISVPLSVLSLVMQERKLQINAAVDISVNNTVVIKDIDA